jgi:GTP pyrophosphokinase
MGLLSRPTKTKSSLEKAEEKLLHSSKEYLAEKDFSRVKEALEFSKSAHDHDKRKSGEPFAVHPILCALRVSDLHLDSNTIIAALLHDTLEDTEVTAKEIRSRFGADVLSMVEALTKLSNIRIKKSWFPLSKTDREEITEMERQAETLRKMLIAMSKDVRVIFIKLSDKIHNLETLKYLPEEKRERIAKEAIDIFAPIAGRLGMGEWKGLLEDLSFPFVSHDDYEKVKHLAVPQIKVREEYLKKIVQKTKKMLETAGFKSEIGFRAKKWYSLYRKLEKYDWEILKIYDLIAIRIIVDNIEECYGVLGTIHGEWRPLIGRIKDYIALPKPNGYRSIHTTVFCDDGKIVEFQIRTKDMNYQAEFGVASHWIYEENKTSRKPNKSELQWIDDFYQIQKDLKTPEDLIKSFKMDLFEDRIFVFTPAGDVKDLPREATPIDFAYSIHSDIGNKCSGAKVNGKIASLDTKLQNGDIVEILKRENAKPRPDWLKFVKTEQARAQIKKVTKYKL